MSCNSFRPKIYVDFLANFSVLLLTIRVLLTRYTRRIINNGSMTIIIIIIKLFLLGNSVISKIDLCVPMHGLFNWTAHLSVVDRRRKKWNRSAFVNGGNFRVSNFDALDRRQQHHVAEQKKN